MFDVIILNWNGREWLTGCLDSLRCQSFRDFQVWVVDNGSTDDSVQLITERYPEVKLLALGENTGFCRGNNLGAARASREWIIVLNNDTRCRPDFLESLARAARRHPQFDLLACKSLFMDDPRQVDNKGIRYSSLLFASQIGSGKLDDSSEQPREVFGPSGVALTVRRKVVEAIGLFDERFRIYHEDVDFVVRARLHGYRCLYVPDAVLLHKGHGTSRRVARERVYQNQRNMELVPLKNIPASLLWRGIPLRLPYAIFQIMRAAARGEGCTVLRAKVEGWRMGWAIRRENPPQPIDMEDFKAALKENFQMPSVEDQSRT